jgi:hypothetical protein
MRKRIGLLSLCFLLACPLLFGAANNPFSPNAQRVQGPDKTGNQGYPIAVVGAPGGDPVNVAVTAAPTTCVTQCTSPWVVSGTVTANQGGAPWSVSQSGAWTVTANQGTSPWVTGFGGVRQPVDCTQTTSPWAVSGTITANQGTNPWTVKANDTDGTAATGNVFPSGGVDGGNTTRRWDVESDGTGQVSLHNSTVNREKRFGTTTFRTVGNAAAVQNLATIELTGSAGSCVRIRRVYVASCYTAALAAFDCSVLIGRTTAVPTGGTALAKVAYDTRSGSLAGVIVRGATAGDGGAATAITATIVKAFERQFIGRIHTAVGQTAYGGSAELIRDGESSANYPVIGNGQAMVIQVENATAASNAATNHYVVAIEWEEATQI